MTTSRFSGSNPEIVPLNVIVWTQDDDFWRSDSKEIYHILPDDKCCNAGTGVFNLEVQKCFGHRIIGVLT